VRVARLQRLRSFRRRRILPRHRRARHGEERERVRGGTPEPGARDECGRGSRAQAGAQLRRCRISAARSYRPDRSLARAFPRRSPAMTRAIPAARKPLANDDTQRILRHWRDAVPDDRMAHLVKDATRALVKALQRRLAVHGVSFGHWTFLRILWETDGLTQRDLSREAGVMEPTTFAALKA